MATTEQDTRRRVDREHRSAPGIAAGTTVIPAPLREFAADLAERTEPPARRIAAIGLLSDGDLRTQTRATARVLERFAEAMRGSDAAASIDALVRSLGPKEITRDHGWREVFDRVGDEARAGTEHRRIAARAYTEYLEACVEVLESVAARRRAMAETASLARVAREAAAVPDDVERLPRGEPVEVAIPYRGERVLWLGRHRFRIQDGVPPSLVDPEGVPRGLRNGRQRVGRHVRSDIVVDVAFPDVSRLHLTLEWTGGTGLRITDHSTLGTYLEPVSAPEPAPAEAGGEASDGERSVTAGSRTGDVCLAVVSRDRDPAER